ncbi:hypothetical protein H2202_000282 [Exophiala xenobiotica]|nr:hypothetical protein H2202_000282 [Exophiala xenobiotica]KAK5193926.1 hypothetical protein LTR92_006266 [Exophiala xenobiotica]KAK5211764.1 hypothetical protein LTR41_003225 [Exophiala xenobiotica]KAK5222833.1 hypothetical protein LTR72_005670 [Exophiala xenobiotica]KAK5237002.1 hypothetical protein LTR47_002180 [Exophiala xenobiotica]
MADFQQQQQQPHHPIALRPGGPSSRSTSPQPQPQQQYPTPTANTLATYDGPTDDMPGSYPPRNPSGTGPGGAGGSNYGPSRSQSPPSQVQQGYSNSNGARFPSSHYPPLSPTNEPGAPSGNPYAEPSRSRSSTIGQNYPIALGGQQQPPLPMSSPPQQTVQPLFSQHSGHQLQQPQSSRPVSRGANAANNMSGPGPSTRPTSSAKSPFSTPITSPPRQRPQQILLINPNSTRSMTDACLSSLRPIVPPGVEVTGYTAPYPAPTAIESTTDAIMSTEAVLRDLAKYAASNGETVQNYDGMIVACFSKHPLIDALRESYDVPIIGIMEASLYTARMIGGRFGIIATAARSKYMQDDAVAAYGLDHFYVGSEATHLGVLELENRPREEVAKRMAHAARALVAKGADTILLGCAGMTDLVRAAKDGVRDEDGRRTVNVIDSVEAGLLMMTSLVGMGIPTSKKGVYKGEKEARRTRGQNWL